MNRRRIVVIGANAFSGQDFVDLLLDDPRNQVYGISRSPERSQLFLRYRTRPDLSRYQYQQLDLNQEMPRLLSWLDEVRPSHIVNFAAQSEVAPSWQTPGQYFQTNLVALCDLVNHLRSRDYLERFLQVSSPEAYGNCVGTVTESTPDNPTTPYASSKAAADMVLSCYFRQFGLPVVTVRATNVYGARQQLFKIIPRTAIYIRLGRTIELHGGGRAIKSFIHIRDVSRGELAVLDHGVPGERYHLSPDQGVSIRELVAAICSRLEVDITDVTRIVDERPGQDAAYVIDSTKARTAFDWRPQISLETGIAEVIEWVDGNLAEIRNHPLEYQHRP